MARRTPSARDDRNPFDPLDGRVDETLDLHGYAAVEARAFLTGFLTSAQRRHPGALLHIITGRGKRSATGPVLKPLVKATLGATPASVVNAWGKDDNDGGFLVRLAGRR
ncbi:MAG: Smr/MutS family protein [Cytophagaceae bacterium]|nr:Smr/MutS family protein [Gemmatimonadaceae bacterium]